MNTILLFGMPGGAEIIIIILVIIMFFGADKIPEFARMLGKGMREVKNAKNDIQREIRESASPITDITDKVDIKKQVKDLISDNVKVNHAPTTKEVIQEDEIPTDVSQEEMKEEEENSVAKTVARKSPYGKVESPKPKEEKD